MSQLNDERWAFLVDYFDPNADLMRQYQLLYYLGDSTLEMYDIKNRRTLLKRTDYPSITADHLFIGAEVTVYSKKCKVVAYADAFTEAKLKARSEKTVVQAPIGNLAAATAALAGAGLRINQLKTIAREGTKTVVMEVVASGAIETAKALGMEASADADAAAADIEMFFGNVFPNGAAGADNTLAIILPHAVMDGRASAIIDAISSSGLEIACAQMFSLGRANATEFLEVYKGVLPEYQKKVIELTAGPVVALEVVGAEAVLRLREVTGPHDPDIARVIRPNSVRAQHGIDKVQNALHVTDLPDDGQLETEYFFSMLARAS